MKSRARVNAEASAATQLAVEIEWLAGNLPGSMLRTPPELSSSERDIARRVKEILRNPKLVPFLSIVEQHNHRPHREPGRRTPSKSLFLLGPHLFQVLESVQARNEMRQKLPALDQPAAAVRGHLQDASARCRALADLIRKGPQPHVALAARTDANAVLKVFMRTTELFEASDDGERQVVAFTELMERAAGWFDALARNVPRSTQNRRPAETAAEANADDLRSRAAEFLLGVFLKRLGHPYHAHVATIATVISGLPTNADFVKKVELRRTEPKRFGDRLTRKITETVT